MSRKSRGCNYERKLVHLLHELGFFSVRAAGSGCIRYASPDIVASNGTRLLAFEVKSTQSDRVYLKNKDVVDLLSFARGFRAEPWFAVHFSGNGWFYKRASELLGLDVLRLDAESMHRQF